MLMRREGHLSPPSRPDHHQQVVLRPDPRAAAAARDVVRSTGTLWDLEEETLDATLLVVSELVTNAVVNTRSEVTVRLRLRPDRLLVEVQDEDSRLPVLQEHNDWDALGGRGLPLVAALSTRWGAHPCPAGKVVWAELQLVPDPPAATTG